MDSMRNLSGSLPSSNSRSRQPTPPEDLLQTFKQAALSVTNLYKRAADEMAIERRAGYQDAIYELLSLLDKENIGLGDGEGWRIRQWATEKQQSGPERDAGSEGEEHDAEDRETSPVIEGRQRVPPESSPVRENESEHVRSASSPETATATATAASERHVTFQPPSADAFTFQSNHSYPEPAMEVTSVPSDQQTGVRVQHMRQGSNHRTIRRGSHVTQRQAHRHARSLGPGAGNKRKEHFGHLFGLSSLGDGKDLFGGGGGPKRPRPL